jgi:simple sugar transport system permease protein
MIPQLDYIIDKILPAFVTFYLVSLGHSIFEKSGILNLAIDGVFFTGTGAALLGAILPIIYNIPISPPVMGVLVATLIAAILGLFMSSVLTFLPISHGAVGLSLQFFSYGVGIMLGYYVRLAYGTIYGVSFAREDVLYLSIISLVIGVILHLFIERTKIGAAIRAVGENPHSAAALGVRVMAIRIVVGMLGFALIGFGGALFILSWQRSWDVKLFTLGYGWLAFATALAAGRHPIVLIPVSLLFGGLVNSQTDIQSRLGIPADVAKLIPFLAALALMLIYSTTRLRRIFASPSSLGKPYYKEEKSI